MTRSAVSICWMPTASMRGRQQAPRRDVDGQLLAGLRPGKAHRQGLVADEDGVGQQHRRRIDAVFAGGVPLAFPQGVRHGAVVRERAVETKGNARLRTVDQEPPGAPFLIVGSFEDPGVDGDRRRQLARLPAGAILRPFAPRAPARSRRGVEPTKILKRASPAAGSAGGCARPAASAVAARISASAKRMLA